METSLNTRGDPTLYLGRSPHQKIQRHEVRGLPVRSLPSQTRDGFLSHQALSGITGGKTKGPIKLESAFAPGKNPKASPTKGPVKLEPGSAKPLAVKSAAHLKL